MNVKDRETQRLALQIAKVTGESFTEAIRRSLQERLQRLRLRRNSRARIMRDQIDEILRRVDALPELDSRTEDEILGYDDRGLPR
jgi:antitoxin VapB